MSELQDNPHENSKYNEHLYKVLKQEGLTDKVKWEYVKKEHEFVVGLEVERSRAQLPSVLLPKILEGFEKIPIKKDANRQPAQEEYLYDFSCCDFLDDVDFREAIFTGEASFWDAKFTGDAYFMSAKFTGDAYFSNATFTGEASFCSAIFDKKAYFSNATFTGEASFNDVKFTGEVAFRNVIFEKKASFSSILNSTTFEKEADFSGVKFTGNAYFSYVKFTGNAYFSYVKFDEVANFGNSKFKLADFEKSVFKKQAYFLEAIIDTLKFAGTHIETSVHFLKSTIKNTDRETARIIKHEYYKLNNNLEAMRWNTRELEEYRKELIERKPETRKSIKKLKNEIKKLKSKEQEESDEQAIVILQEKKQKIKNYKLEWLARFVLWVQNVTTQYGTNWVRGISFLLIMNFLVIMFLFALLLLKRYLMELPLLPKESFAYYIDELLYAGHLLFSFIYPLHTSELITDFQKIFIVNIPDAVLNLKGGWFYGVFATIDMLFRALNTTLLYLTVGAFRRLSRTK